MKITTKTEHSQMVATVIVEKEEWIAAQDKAYVKLGANVEINGFRKGKAPLDQVKKHIPTDKMLETAGDAMLEAVYNKVMEEKKPNLAGRPNADYKKVTPEELEIEFVMPLYPTFELPQYKDVEVAKAKVTVKAEEVDARLAQYQEQFAEVAVKEEGIIAKGDIVNFDFEGFVDGKAFDGGKAEKFDLEIGSNKFIPGFEDQMIGLKKGQETSINVKFPDQYTKELAGKDATFKLKINEVSVKKVPELNDDLALDVNIEGVSTLEELKKHIKEDIKAQKETAEHDKAVNELVKKITGAAVIEIPELLIQQEAANQVQSFREDVESRGLEWNKYLEIAKSTEQSLAEQFKSGAVENLKTMFVLNEIAKKEKITVSDEDIENEFKNIANMYNMEVEKVKEVLGARKNEIANDLYSKKLVKFITENNKII